MWEPEDKDKDDLESVLYFPMDKTFNHLVDFIYKQYQETHPHSDPSVPLRCEFVFFAVSVTILIVVTLVRVPQVSCYCSTSAGFSGSYASCAIS